MTEPTTAPDVRAISLDLLDAGDNPRETMDATELEELVTSIRARGVLTPIRVRPNGDRFRVVFGHRRTAAARRAGLETIPAEVVDLDDEQALEDALVENRVRVPVNPLEEATAVARLIELGKPMREVAAALGVSAARARRLANLATLAPEVRQAIEESPVAASWTEDRLELLALITPSLQEEVLDYFGTDWAAPPLDELRDYIRDACRRLDLAPWKLDDDAIVPGRPACDGCEERSDVIGGLFEGITEKASMPAGAAVCRNAACWKEKSSKWLLARYADARSAEGDALVLVNDEGREGALLNEWPGPERPLGSWDYEEVKRTGKDTVPAFVATGKRQGETIRVRVKFHGSDSGRQRRNAPKPEKGSAADIKHKRAHLANRRKAWVVDHLVERLGVVVEHVELGEGEHAAIILDELPVLELVARYGSGRLWDGEGRIEQVALRRRIAVLGVTRDQLPTLHRSGFTGLDEKHERALDLAKTILGVTAEELEAAAVEAVKTPRALQRALDAQEGEKD